MNQIEMSMPRHARTFLSTLVCVAATLRFQCNWKLPFGDENPANSAGIEIPVYEKALRAADFILMEPGYAQSRELAAVWQKYTAAFATDEKRSKELEQLANEPAILGLLNDLDGRLAPVFRAEATEILGDFGNHALRAWRLRSLAGKTILAHNEKLLKAADEVVTRREITARHFTIPIQGTGFNFSLDAEWDISRLSDFPLSQVNSEYLFFQTDHNLNLVALPNGPQLPDAAFRFVSGNKFVAEPHGLQHGMRIIAVRSPDHFLIICYPFAGFLFYAVRGGLLILLLAGSVMALAKLRSLKHAAGHILENRSGKWLAQHYEQSLSLNEKAVGLTDQSIAVVEQMKTREAEVFTEIGRQLHGINQNFAEKTQLLIDETLKSHTSSATTSSPATTPGIIRPLHKKLVRKDAILIEQNIKPEIQVSIELDLPLSDEKQLAPAAKTTLVSSLKRQAREKSAIPDFIHDERMDNYDYVPPEPIIMPKIDAASVLRESPDTANLDYVQKFRYAGKTRVLPMSATETKTSVLNVREDLHAEELVITEEE